MVKIPAFRVALNAALALAVGAAAGCADFDIALDTVFPPAVPGLPAEGSWVSLPIGSWVVDGGIQAQAISACFARNCADPAAVGLFTATGPTADQLAALVARPEGLARELAGRERRARVRVEVEPLRAGPMQGAALRLARADGTHAAYGVVLGSRSAGRETALIVIATREEVARRLAQDVATSLE